ncbi:MAG: Ig-like domain-containing protein, partial [Verrucomicrobiota bacterium]
MAWDPSPDTNVVGYNVYYGVASRTYTNIVDVGDVTNATISGLVEGTTYYFAVTAYNILGMESAYSAEVSYTVPASTGTGNQAPTLNAIASLTINSNTGLIPNPTVNYSSPGTNGTLTFTPVANANGSATITVTVNDGGVSNNIVTRTFTVTVNPVNQPPTLNAISSLTINENAGLQTVNLTGISSGAANEVQTLTVTAASSNTGLIPNPTVNYSSPGTNGTLTFTPVANANGSATITVTV